MFHAEILHFMPHLTKLFADPEDICLGPSVRVQEFIDDQNFHFHFPPVRLPLRRYSSIHFCVNRSAVQLPQRVTGSVILLHR